MTIADLEQLQTEHPDWQMELVDGSILVMGPSDYESDEIGTRFSTFLNNWVMPRRSEHQLAIATAMRQKVPTCDACGKLD